MQRPASTKDNVHFVLVPPSPQQSNRVRQRAHEYFYKCLLPMIGQTHFVKFVLPNRNCTVADTADSLIATIRDRVVEIRRMQRDVKLILVGWGTSCLLNFKVILLCI